MASNTPIILKADAQEKIIQLYRACATNFLGTWNIRDQLLEADRLYMRERDMTAEQAKAVVANRAGDPTKFQNIQVPVVMNSVESAVTYQSSVFLTGSPLFAVSASSKYMDSALQMETIIDDQSVKGGWPRQLQLAIRDGYKYNMGIVDVDWERKKIFTPETNLAFSPNQAKAVETYWEGNTVKRVDPYNTFFDVRYKPTDMSSRGEFFGYSELMCRTEFVRFMQSLAVKMNYKKACESGPSSTGTVFPYDYYIPQLNPKSLIDQSTAGSLNWMSWVGLEPGRKNNINFRDSYIVTKMYARIIPFDLGIASDSPYSPQIWKFYICNGNVLVYAERQTNAHDMIPMLVAQPLEDGLGYQTKSLSQNSEPFQSVSSALVNSAIASRRRALADRGLYDPSRVDAKAINNDSASAKIPVRPSAYGRPLGEAYFPIPYQDQQSAQAMSDLTVMMNLNDQVTGLNRAQQGQFQKGNKTLFEYQNVMGNADARQQNTSLLIEYQFFQPLKEIVKLNVLQYQAPATVFSRAVEREIAVDPVTLRKANLIFTVSDGQLPASKQMNSESFTAAAQAIGSSPQLAGAYNIGPMFSYLFKSQRADVAQFEKSPQLQQYEQAMGAWQQTVGTLAETYAKLKKPDGSGYTPQEIQAALPPQPQPQQFGVDPANPYPTKAEPPGTILQQVGQVDNANQPQQ
jgi:hypothetical protein